MVDPRTGDLDLPLVDMNPMGKEHLPPLLALDAAAAGAVSAKRPARQSARRRSNRRANSVATVASTSARGGAAPRSRAREVTP